jgi:PKD repeat protein
MKCLLSILFSAILIPCIAQQSRQDKLIEVKRTDQSSSVKSLEARFTADITQGTAPLTVQFTDQSTGNPTSWKWTFGDGDSSLVQNPIHIYQSTGLYTVKLSISDGTSGFALEKKDYIRVNLNYVNCDTLRYPLPEPLTYYIITNKGYVTGNNSYGDKAIADYFENTQPNLVITGLICEFSKAKQAAGNNEKLPVRIWKSEVSSGKPGQLLASDTITLSTIVNDVTNNRITTLDFENPVQPGSSFFMGVMLPVITGDTLSFWSTSSGKLAVNTTWILQSTDVWESAQTLWSPQGGPAFIISSAIYPKICLLNGINNTEIPVPFAVWPNPAHDIITVVNQQNSFENSQFTIFDISGKELLKGSISGSLSTTIDVSRLSPGIYILHINGKKSVFSSRLIIN